MEFITEILPAYSELIIKISVGVVGFYLLTQFLWKKRKNYPPGPTGLPILGYLPFLTAYPHLKLEELRKKYGNIFSLYLGRQYTVILGDANSTRDAFAREEFHGRPDYSVLAPGVFSTNISNVNGRDWNEQRKLVFHALRGAGKGNEFVEKVVKDEVRYFLQVVEESKGRPLSIKEYLSTTVSNILTMLVFSKRYDHESKTRLFLNECIQEIVEHSSQIGVQNFFPWLGSVPIVNKYGGWDKYQEVLRQLKKFFEGELIEHEKTLDPNNIRDFIDASLLQEMKAKEEGTHTSCSREMLYGTLWTLLAAGSETVRTSLQWLFYALVCYPEVQKKVQKEIDEVVGRERDPRWADQRDMPYTLSVIMEAQRLFTIVPLNILHYTIEDAKIGGYDIPKDTVVISNSWAILRDPNQWEKPDQFIPERFLDESRENIARHKSYIPFSYGKRICPGEALSMIEMFMFLVATLQKYDVRPRDGAVISLKPEYFITTQPEEQDLCFLERS